MRKMMDTVLGSRKQITVNFYVANGELYTGNRRTIKKTIITVKR